MTTGLIYHDLFLAHDTAPNHPERPDRLGAIINELDVRHILNDLKRITPSPATPDQVALIHTTKYIQHIQEACANSLPYMDYPDTHICVESYDAALVAAGGLIEACDKVMANTITNAFCAVRPPGHHAESSHAMGFCLFNSIAIAAQHLITSHSLQRIAIVDFDVHHGNGTQHAFESRNDVLFISLHEHPRFLFPGTGYEHETGSGQGAGYTLNISMLPGTTDDSYDKAFTQSVLPKLNDYQPQFILISAGFDALAQDSIAHIDLTPDAFSLMTQRLIDVANTHCHGRIVSTLEGGYDLDMLAKCTADHIQKLMTSQP